MWQSGAIWAGILLHSGYNATLLTWDAFMDAGLTPLFLDPDTEFGAVGLVLLFIAMASAVTGVVLLGRRAGRVQSPPAVGLTADGLGP